MNSKVMMSNILVLQMKKVQKMELMSEKKDNIENNKFIYNVKSREIFESTLRQTIKRKHDSDPDEGEIEEENNHLNI